MTLLNHTERRVEIPAVVLASLFPARGLGRQRSAGAPGRRAARGRPAGHPQPADGAHGPGERARIARELHDVVAHHISVVAVQAETARLPAPGMPEAGAQRHRPDGRHPHRGRRRHQADHERYAGGPFLRASSWPCTASSRRHSPTRGGTRRGLRLTSS
ncbi:histidine kinase dimerization/phosphoacceptor domain-containing protein [Streptomyces sp. NPDC058221]|uniref:histidine kinase dimerization/phosphoacceptor domain-containing protein n=1 Tax=Streptomyces sp. NPDC058221 TaxID=3346388 RepID=UPI0036E59747